MPSTPRGARRALAASAGLAVAVTGLSVFAPAPAQAVSSSLVISEIYGGGGNGGSTWKSDFIELHNPTGAAVSVDGWSVQWRSGGSTAAAAVTPLSGSVPAGGYYLVKQADGAGGTTALPTPDATGTITMGSTSGTAILANTTAAQNPAAGAFAGSAAVVDLVGVGSNTFENAATPEATTATGMSNTQSVSRTSADGDDNSAEFTAGVPTPTNSAGDTAPPSEEPTEATIPEIQGTGDESPLKDDLVETTGVVTAAYPRGLFGFYLQTPGSGGAIDLTTHEASQAVFVYYPFGAGDVTVEPGDHVTVVGTVAEFAGGTQVRSTEADTTVLDTPAAAAIPATTAAWPATDAAKESLEGMLYDPADSWTVTDTYTTAQYGEIGLALGDGVLVQPTEVARPGSVEADAVAAQNEARRIVLDDGSTTNYSNGSSSNGYTPTNGHLTPAYLSQTNPVRVGAPATLTGPVILTEGGSNTAPTYRFQPLTTVTGPDNAGSPISVVNTRTTTPDATAIDPQGTADVKVASFNVLNYFTTLGDPDNDQATDNGGCLPFNDADGDGNTVRTGCDQRGAWDAEDLARQQEKIVAAINALDADVVGLMEIENSARVDGAAQADEATETLVAALNADAGPGTWAANPSSADLPEASEMDVISNAIIYKPAAVTRTGEARALGNLGGDDQAFGNAREPIAQAFTPVAGGEPFTVVVNHFKSKGSAGPWAGDTDQGDGQGAGNVSRTMQAEALVAWVTALEASSGIEATTLLGDFNAYSQEDPMQVLYEAGYVDVESVTPGTEYSYSFDGLSGSLDHVLVDETLRSALTGADIWNINSVEAIGLEYSRYNQHSTDFHEPTPFRSSDHDPVVMGLDLVTPAEPEPAPVKATIKVKHSPSKVVAGKTRATLKITVKADGTTPTGKVTVKIKGGKTLKATLKNGKAKVKLPKFAKPGRQKLTVTYQGSDEVTSKTVTYKLKVVKGKKNKKN